MCALFTATLCARLDEALGQCVHLQLLQVTQLQKKKKNEKYQTCLAKEIDSSGTKKGRVTGGNGDARPE